MRVTNNMMILNMMRNMNNNLTNMSKYQDQLSTGKAISSPMDDPVGIAKVLKYKTDLSELGQYERNTNDAYAWLDNTETALQDVNSVYQRLRELAVQAATGTNTIEETQKIKSEIEQLKSHTVNLANTTFAGRYIFSSYHTDEKLMNEDGTYNIDITSLELNGDGSSVYQVGVGENIEVSSNGLDIFGYEPIANYMSANFPDGMDEGQAATSTEMAGTVDFENNYNYSDPGPPPIVPTPIVLSVGGTNYTVDLNDMIGSSAYPLSKQDVIDAINNATDGASNTLGSTGAVDVFFDKNDNLIIRTTTEGAAAPALNEVGNVLFATAGTAGTNHVPASISSGGVLNDADFPTATGPQSFMVTLNGHTEKITVDTHVAGTVSSVADLVSEIQSAINTQFPSGATDVKIAVSGSDGTAITFSTVDPLGNGSTAKHVLEVRPIQATESTLMKDLDDFIAALDTNDKDQINQFIDDIDGHLDVVLQARSDIGARMNRMELVLNRIAENNVNFTRLLSNAEDADMSEVIMYMKNAENVYRASLQTGARVIQPSLLDFLR